MLLAVHRKIISRSNQGVQYLFCSVATKANVVCTERACNIGTLNKQSTRRANMLSRRLLDCHHAPPGKTSVMAPPSLMSRSIVYVQLRGVSYLVTKLPATRGNLEHLPCSAGISACTAVERSRCDFKLETPRLPAPLACCGKLG